MSKSLLFILYSNTHRKELLKIIFKFLISIRKKEYFLVFEKNAPINFKKIKEGKKLFLRINITICPPLPPPPTPRKNKNKNQGVDKVWSNKEFKKEKEKLF